MKAIATSRPRVTKKQLEVLTLIYEFRFVNNSHIQALLKQKFEDQARQCIRLLYKKEYVGRIRSGRDRLVAKYTSYYLLPKGLQALRTYKPDINPRTIKNLGNDRKASDNFVKRCLLIGDINIEFDKLYGDKATFFTRSNMKKYDYFPKPLPDAYIPLKVSDEKRKFFFLDIYDYIPHESLSRRRVRQYIKYAEEGEWESYTRTTTPIVLMIFHEPFFQKQLSHYVFREIDRSVFDIDHLTFMATTLDELKASKSPKDPIWQRITSDGVSEEQEALT